MDVTVMGRQIASTPDSIKTNLQQASSSISEQRDKQDSVLSDRHASESKKNINDGKAMLNIRE